MSQAISAPGPEHDGHFMMIPLTQGKFAIVDEADAERILAMGKWCAIKNEGSRTYYAAHSGPVYMHSAIAGYKGVDHANRNGLDNRRINLRPATAVQNLANTAPPSRNTSGYKGVSPLNGKWHAQINLEGRRVHLGIFGDPAAAAHAYNQAAFAAWGEYAWLNPLPDGMELRPLVMPEPKAKLTEEAVLRCRALAAAGRPISALAAEFGVTSSAMRRAVRGKSWRHLPMPERPAA